MLTERRIRDAKADGKYPIVIWDKKVKGFGVRVYPSGAKTYVIGFRAGAGGRRAQWRVAKLADASMLSLADARERAAAELVAIADGEPSITDRRREERKALSVAEAMEQYFSSDQYRKLKPRSQADYRRYAQHVLPSLGKIKVRDVKRQDVEKAIRRHVAGDVQRNRHIEWLRRFFNLCERWEWRERGSNPCVYVERTREKPRDRVLSDDEMRALGSALSSMEDDKPAPVAAIRFAMLTGLRISEVLRIRWEHVDLAGAIVHLPATKTGDRNHDLPDAAISVLNSQPRRNSNPHVFNSGRMASPLGYSLTRRVWIEACRSAGISGATLHDARRSIITKAAASGINSSVLAVFLGHATERMAQRYISLADDAAREARRSIGADVAGLIGTGSE